MATVNAIGILKKAVDGRYAVGAFNVTDLSQMKAAVEAAEESRAPLIIQTSVTPSRFLGAGLIVAAYRALASQAGVPVCLHLDHCTEVEYCKTCADAGYTNIMIDSSKLPFAENIRQTKEVCDYVHRRGGLSVEGELGTVPGIEDQVQMVEEGAQLCDPPKRRGVRGAHGGGSFCPCHRDRPRRIQDS